MYTITDGQYRIWTVYTIKHCHISSKVIADNGRDMCTFFLCISEKLMAGTRVRCHSASGLAIN